MLNKRKHKKLTAPAAISDDEQSDVSGEFAIPIKEKRAKSRSAEYRDDILETKSEEEEISGVKGDLNGGRAKSVTKAGDEREDDSGEEDEDEDGEGLEPDECVLRGQLPVWLIPLTLLQIRRGEDS